MTLPTHLSGAAQAAARGEASTTFLGNVAAYDTAAALPAVQTFHMPIALYPVNDGLTAKSSGTHATGTALTGSINNLGTVAADNDSVVLPVMSPGEIVAVINSGSKSAQVYAAGTGTINGVATDTGVALASGKVGIYVAVTASNIRGGTLA
jgi:hypothetical protein